MITPNPSDMNDSFRSMKRKEYIKAKRKVRKNSQKPMMVIPNKRNHK